MDWSLTISVISIIVSCALFAAGLGWWLSNQFEHNRKHTYQVVKEMKEEIFMKLEYHERHDDARFGQVDDRFGRLRNDIWEIRLRNASKDAYLKQLVNEQEKQQIVEERNDRRKKRQEATS